MIAKSSTLLMEPLKFNMTVYDLFPALCFISSKLFCGHVNPRIKRSEQPSLFSILDNLCLFWDFDNVYIDISEFLN